MESNLIYTVAFDPPGEQARRQAAKLLVSSLLRTGFTGDIVVVSNSAAPVFFIDRKGVEEIVVELEVRKPSEVEAAARAWRFLVADVVEVERYSQVVYLAVDSLVLRNIDHLFPAELIYGFQMAGGPSSRAGVDEGVFSISGSEFRKTVEVWQDDLERADGSPAPDWWRRFLGDHCRSGAMPLEQGEVFYPLSGGALIQDMVNASVLRLDTGPWSQRLSFQFGQYMSRFYWDGSGAVINVLEP